MRAFGVGAFVVGAYFIEHLLEKLGVCAFKSCEHLGSEHLSSKETYEFLTVGFVRRQ